MNLVTQRRKARIAVISYIGLSRLIHSLVTEFSDSAEFIVIDKVFEEATQIARNLIARDEVDVILSAGANGAYLADTVGIPVVRIPVTGVDVMRALLKAGKVTGRVAVVTYRAPNSELDEIKDLVTVEIEQRTYTTAQNAQEVFSDLAQQGFRVIIGSSLPTELAEREGLTGILVYSNNSVRAAIGDALEIARIRNTERQQTERMDAILSHLDEGVAAVDSRQQIVLMNPAMETLTGLTEDVASGRRFEEVAPEFSLREVFRSGNSCLDHVEKFKKRVVVTSRIPILRRGDVAGAVLTVKDAQAVSRADRSVRSRNRRTKFVAQHVLSDIVGQCTSVQDAREICEQYAVTDGTVLISGETGTGKELLAQGIHNASRRRDAPFVAVNCAAIPDTLLESELFGYEEGAFTGSRRGGQAGLFELAHTGTICLDEIGEMPVALQSRLLRVLQEKTVMPLGGEPARIDVRVIAVTNRDLRQAIDNGTFRRDLYYRLNILNATLPPLRERIDDIPLLADKLLRNKLGMLASSRNVEEMVRRLQPYLARHNWPGNVRELENIMERLAVLWAVSEDFLCRNIERQLRATVPELFAKREGDDPKEASSLKEFVERTEYDRILETVQRCHGNISEAARQLKLSRTTLWRKLRPAR